MVEKNFIPNKLKPWIEARRRFRLTHAQVQMARELGLNPKKLGGMANHHQERWKLPLPEYIEFLYEKQFGRLLPENTLSLEKREAARREKKLSRKVTPEEPEHS